jgi:phosphatidylserine/phosphatidylglycerophosphate/cardiolipin synthase-like enzyme
MSWATILLIFALLPLSAYSLEVFQVSGVRTFVSPDSSYDELKSLIETAKTAVYINTYTITNPEVAELLEKAETRGIEVILMLDGMPVGGVPEDEVMIADRLIKAGAVVCFHSSEKIRYNHAKYIIVDNYSTVITTENLGRAGFPRENHHGSRGWGVVILDDKFSEALASVFFSDLRDCRPKGLPEGHRKDRDIGRHYQSRYPPKEYIGSYKVELFIAPEEGISPILRLLESSNASISVEQAYIYEHWGSKRKDTPETAPNLFLEAIIDAARRGVKVRILLDSYWYNVLENDPVSNIKTLEYVNAVSREEGLDLEARLADLKALGLQKLHTKGVIVDGDVVLISSINWNEHSPTKNREIGVIVYGEPAQYFTEVFECDWDPSECIWDTSSRWVYLMGVLALIVGIMMLKGRFKCAFCCGNS